MDHMVCWVYAGWACSIYSIGGGYLYYQAATCPDALNHSFAKGDFRNGGDSLRGIEATGRFAPPFRNSPLAADLAEQIHLRRRSELLEFVAIALPAGVWT